MKKKKIQNIVMRIKIGVVSKIIKAYRRGCIIMYTFYFFFMANYYYRISTRARTRVGGEGSGLCAEYDKNNVRRV